MILFNQINDDNISRNKRYLRNAVIGVFIIVILVCFFIGFNSCKSNDDTTQDNNTSSVIVEDIDTSNGKNAAQSGNVLVVSDHAVEPYIEMGYESHQEYIDDMENKHKNAKAMYDEAMEKYKNVITEPQKEDMKKYMNQMVNSASPIQYDDALEKFNKVKESLIKEYECTGGVGRYSGGDFNIPYNFKAAGVLYDSDYRYTYYSSRVLYHYKTPQWTLCKDGIYRDSEGRVIVASDTHKNGTVIQSELFGTCVVQDCGVGDNSTLDVYVNW